MSLDMQDTSHIWMAVVGGRAVLVADNEPITRQEAAERAMQHLERCLQEAGLSWDAEDRLAVLGAVLQTIRVAERVAFSMLVQSGTETPSVSMN